MSVTVTLHMYSGVPDPTWELTDVQSDELADRIARVSKTTLLKPPGIVGGLGYRGFSVTAVREKKLDPEIYIHAGIIDLDRFDLNRIADDVDLEQWLLGTAGNAIEPDVEKYVQGELAGRSTVMSPASVPAYSIMAVPPYNPGKWNNDPNIRTRNNCYNYANDKITNTFAQPGKGSGQIGPFPPACGGTGAAAQRDGQIPVASASSTPAQGHFVALVIWPGRDYHWYRLDSNAMWSHKPGQTAARNTDNSGRTINDPKNCDRGPYTAWCGYYHCIPANTRIA
ncbi:MAG: hypothetical protein ACPHN2_05495 [Sinimarinibacterium flocculans]|uniref:hypothetical protein n=1 Tax=Sinimarinibacterium flocculans TaxID=985250 RepID=UPI003C65740E